jgi:hypothetical protein
VEEFEVATGGGVWVAIGDLRSTLQAHRPEVCSPAQGFKVVSKVQDGPLVKSDMSPESATA